jgi:hypothetical protein
MQVRPYDIHIRRIGREASVLRGDPDRLLRIGHGHAWR